MYETFLTDVKSVLKQYKIDCFFKTTTLNVEVSTQTDVDLNDFEYFKFNTYHSVDTTVEFLKSRNHYNVVESLLGLRFTHSSGLHIDIATKIPNKLPIYWNQLKSALENKHQKAIIDVFKLIYNQRFTIKSNQDNLFLHVPNTIHGIDTYYGCDYSFGSIIYALNQDFLVLNHDYYQNNSDTMILNNMQSNQPQYIYVTGVKTYKNIDWDNHNIYSQERKNLEEMVTNKANEYLKQHHLPYRTDLQFWQYNIDYHDFGSDLECRAFFALVN